MSDTGAQDRPGTMPAGRIAVVVIAAAAAFAAAFFLFGGGSDDEASDSDSGDAACTVADAGDAAGSLYRVTVSTEPDPPMPQGSTVQIQVERDGQPVTGASVCVTADMSGMEMDAVGGQAGEVAPGRFELPVDFGMQGAWTGSVVVSEPGQSPVSVPLSLDVQ